MRLKKNSKRRFLSQGFYHKVSKLADQPIRSLRSAVRKHQSINQLIASIASINRFNQQSNNQSINQIDISHAYRNSVGYTVQDDAEVFVIVGALMVTMAIGFRYIN